MKIRQVVLVGALAIGASAAGAASASEVPLACEQDKCFRKRECIDTSANTGCDMQGTNCDTYDCRVE
jgi:hypothetical protein